MTGTVLDGAGGVIQGRSVTWRTNDGSIITVTAAGRVTAVGVGETQVTASIGSVQGGTTVGVTDPPQSGSVSKVELSPATEFLEERQSRQFVVRALDAHGNEITGRGIHWSVLYAEVATVNPGGLVTGLRNGVMAVRARIDGSSAAAGVRIETNYPFELVYSRASAPTGPELFTRDIRDPAAISIPGFAEVRIASDPVASPDGSRIAYVVTTPSGCAIHVVNRDGSNPVALVADGASNDQPSWSFDGSQIVFRRREPNAGSDIWVVNALDGSGAVNVTADHGATNQSSPAWSPHLVLGELKPDSMRARLLAAAERQGELVMGGVQVWIRSAHHYEGSKLKSATPVGYLLAVDDLVVGAVELTDVNPMILLPAGATIELRKPVLAAAMACAIPRIRRSVIDCASSLRDCRDEFRIELR